MNHVFRKQLCKFALVFIDDILIYNRTWEKHLQHLEEVLRILEGQKFYAKLSKCQFPLTEMLYLGHIIGEDRVQLYEEKIRAIQDWPVPRNVTELRGFVGICAYYRKFVKGFSQLAAPLTDLTKKGAFAWTDRAQAAFEHLKEGGHLIAFESQKLLSHERLHSIYGKEMSSIMHALAKFREYLVGNKFKVKTNHNSVRHFLGQKGLNDR
eukprot:PITA_32725